MSNIQQTNQINVNEVTPNTNSEYYLNMMIGSQIANQISKFNAKDGFNYINITTLILLLSIGELKNLVKFISSNTSTYVIDNYKTFFSSLWSFTIGIPKTISSSFNNLLFKKNDLIQIEFAPESPIVTYKIECGNEFANGLVHYLEDSKNELTSNYNILPNREIKFENMETQLINETWLNIEFYYSNIKIKLNSQLNLTFEKSNSIKQKYLKKFNQITLNNDVNNNIINKEEFVKLIHKNTPIQELLVDPVIKMVFEQCTRRSVKAMVELKQDIIINKPETYNTIKDELYYETNSLEFIILLILGYYFPYYFTRKNYVATSMLKIEFLLKLIVYKIQSNYFLDYNENNNFLEKILFNESFTEFYFLDLHLKIPQFITDYIFKKKIVYNFIKIKQAELEEYCIHFFEDTFKVNIDTIWGYKRILLNTYITNSNTFFSQSVNKLMNRIGINQKIKKISVNNVKTTFGITVNSFGCSSSDTINLINGQFGIKLECLENLESSTLEINSSNSNPTISQNTQNTQLNFACISFNNTIDQSQINNIFNEFIDKIKSYGIVSNTNIAEVKICKIKLEKKEIKIEVPNPNYIVYLEKKEMLEKMISSTNNTNNTNNSNQIYTQSETIIKELANIPPKTLNETKIQKEIKVDIVNTDFKSFDTIYLRESDEKKLLSVLTKFKSNKELLKSLGLPNKLCVMLDGLPGTGKSSTILTIASYLKKDIYYLSFGDTIETNEDLQMIFDHVVKNCNGGIIVAEDIDAVGSLLHSRTGQIYQNATQTMETTTKKLSLAYVLNLLQGTITPDNLIFIATTNHIDKLDPAFYRHGRFDVRITFKLSDHYQLNKIYNKFFQRNIPKDLIKRIEENKFTPAQFIFTIKDYISEDFADDIILQDFLDK